LVNKLTEMEDEPGFPSVMKSTDVPYLRHLKEAAGLTIMLVPDGSAVFDDADHWSHMGDHVQSPVLREALRPIQLELEESKRKRWHPCSLCGRVFPALGKSKACPPCRRKWTRRQIQWRLAHAPNDPVAFFIAPPSSRESVWLVIAQGVDAPAALRRIAHAPPTSEDKAALQAALEESEGDPDVQMSGAHTQES
jgi:hypothetical protein